MLEQAFLELAIGQVLDASIDREHEVAALLRFTEQFHVFHDMPEPVADNALGAGLAGQPLVEGQLQGLPGRDRRCW
ncbi:hypothetical protein PEC18_37695 [Paucibacter sp. O1-1]|nr:hypothetical protein [Paucibacter sp. O1-1]MDA3831369.1 hypothetical protein [Paucibacter sp. O1-1]